MSFTIDDLPRGSRYRRAAIAAYAATVARELGDPDPRPSTERSRPSAIPDPESTGRTARTAGRTGPTHQCATCGTTFTAWAPAERHADSHGGGARIDLVL